MRRALALNRLLLLAVRHHLPLLVVSLSPSLCVLTARLVDCHDEQAYTLQDRVGRRWSSRCVPLLTAHASSIAKEGIDAADLDWLARLE